MAPGMLGSSIAQGIALSLLQKNSSADITETLHTTTPVQVPEKSKALTGITSEFSLSRPEEPGAVVIFFWPL